MATGLSVGDSVQLLMQLTDTGSVSNCRCMLLHLQRLMQRLSHLQPQLHVLNSII